MRCAKRSPCLQLWSSKACILNTFRIEDFLLSLLEKWVNELMMWWCDDVMILFGTIFADREREREKEYYFHLFWSLNSLALSISLLLYKYIYTLYMRFWRPFLYYHTNDCFVKHCISHHFIICCNTISARLLSKIFCCCYYIPFVNTFYIKYCILFRDI
jgi:hypothetical protein